VGSIILILLFTNRARTPVRKRWVGTGLFAQRCETDHRHNTRQMVVQRSQITPAHRANTSGLSAFTKFFLRFFWSFRCYY